MKNQAQIFNHVKLTADAAYQYSYQHNDVRNMQIVLRAYKEDFSFDAATAQIKVAREFEKLDA
jgi:hypothetical protein